jgi:hypothetical protein
MNTSILLRRVVPLLSGLVLLGLSACFITTPDTERAKTYTITIKYDAAAKEKWDYKINTPHNDAKKTRVKRKDIVQWKCDDGSLTLFFKGPTPLVKPGTVKELPYLRGAAGAIVEGEVSTKVKPGDEFRYGVSVVLTATGETVDDDPRIFIEH